MARDVGQSEFESAVMDRSYERPVVVDFWAAWCAPCRSLGPILERVADEHGDAVDLVKVDVDANPQLASAFGVQGIPAVKAFRDGRVVSEFVGAYPETAVRQFFDGILPSEADRLAAAADDTEDLDQAEALYSKALEQVPDHRMAVLGLAGILGDRGQHEDARALLARLPDDADVRRLRAHLDLAEAAGGSSADDPLAAAAASGDWRPVLERLLEEVRSGDRDGARDRMIDIFEVLGAEDPLSKEFRARLASALF